MARMILFLGMPRVLIRSTVPLTLKLWLLPLQSVKVCALLMGPLKVIPLRVVCKS